MITTIKRGAITRKQARVIQERMAEGKSVREIAAELGVSRARVRNVATRYEVILPKPQTRRFGFWCARRRAEIIDALATEAGVSPSTMVDRIVSVVLDDGIDHARRRLGKLAIATTRQCTS
jgi:transposase